MSELRLNFTNVSALIVDADQYSRALTKQMLRGFGVQQHDQAASGEEARDYLLKTPADLCLIEADLPDMTGFELVRWLRRREEEALRFMPVIILTGYTQARSVGASRDCGANGVVKKPFSPKTLFEHIAWAAATKRPYLESAGYIGPDRRFHSEADKAPKRRLTDAEQESQTWEEAAAVADAPPVAAA